MKRTVLQGQIDEAATTGSPVLRNLVREVIKTLYNAEECAGTKIVMPGWNYEAVYYVATDSVQFAPLGSEVEA